MRPHTSITFSHDCERNWLKTGAALQKPYPLRGYASITKEILSHMQNKGPTEGGDCAKRSVQADFWSDLRDWKISQTGHTALAAHAVASNLGQGDPIRARWPRKSKLPQINQSQARDIKTGHGDLLYMNVRKRDLLSQPIRGRLGCAD